MSRDVQIGKPLDFLFTLFGNCQGEHRNVVTNDASTDRFSSTLSGTTRAITFLVLVKEKSYSTLFIYIWKFEIFRSNWESEIISNSNIKEKVKLFKRIEDIYFDHDSLSHGESIFVVSSGNFENVTLEFVSELISLNFLSHSLFQENYAILFKMYYFLSSSISIVFWAPVRG